MGEYTGPLLLCLWPRKQLQESLLESVYMLKCLDEGWKIGDMVLNDFWDITGGPERFSFPFSFPFFPGIRVCQAFPAAGLLG